MLDNVVRFRESRLVEGFVCPYCHSKAVVRWGQERVPVHQLCLVAQLTSVGLSPAAPARSLQRYRCKDCRRTFNDHTGTPMARTRRLDKWERFIDCMIEQRTCREAAKIVGICHKTAFYWRHKVLGGLSRQETPTLGGIVEADEKVFRRSYKGSRAFKRGLMGRKARKRGGRAHPDGSIRGFGKDKVAVLLGRSRDGLTVSVVLEHYNGNSVLARFGPVLDPCAVLCTDSSRILRAFARAVGVEHHALNTSRREYKRGIYHIQNVNAYHSRLEGWMEVFHGVATKYLDNYMAWHVFYEQAQRIQKSAAREIVLVNSSPIPMPVRPSRCPNCGKALSVRAVA